MINEMDFPDFVFMICLASQIASLICIYRYYDFREVNEFYLMKTGKKFTHSFLKNLFMIYFIPHLIGFILHFIAYWYIFPDFIIMIPLGFMCFTISVLLRLLNRKRTFSLGLSLFLFFILSLPLLFISIRYCDTFTDYVSESFSSSFCLYISPMFGVLFMDYNTYLDQTK